MTSRASKLACDRALVALAREASSEPVPELDWARIEANMCGAAAIATAPSHTFQRAPRPRRERPSPTWASTPWPIAIAAAAATLILGGPEGATRAPTSGDERAHMMAPRPPVAGFSSLEVGEVAETGVDGAIYNRPGPVSFALAPNSRIEVVANDFDHGPRGGITFALTRGSIHASVTQHSEGEIFAIEVDQTRIAAHGTSFTVTREGARIMVEVAEGSVAVGPVGHRGSTHGWLVAAPDRAAFSLDGAREALWLGSPPPVPKAAPPPSTEPVAATPDLLARRTKRPAASPSNRVDQPASNKVDHVAAGGTSANAAAWGEGANPEGRDSSERESAEAAAIVRHLEACYERQVSASGVRVFVESSLELTLLPSGAIREGIFTPPLSPALMSCANEAIAAAHFPKGETPRQIRIPVQLSRAPR
jgi:hypothetical protein